MVALLEREAVTAARVDRQNGVIRDVKIIGFDSLNGYSYTREALRDAVPMYEGAPVFVNHPDRSYPDADRDINDKIGWLENVKLESDGLRGDLYLLLSDPRAAKILEAAERRPSLFGLSHNAQGDRDSSGQVTRIHHVRSVDLVSDPATTAGLFESCSSTPSLVSVIRGGRGCCDIPLPRQKKPQTFKPLTESGWSDRGQAATILADRESFLRAIR